MTRRMTKYEPLHEHLQEQPSSVREMTLTFADIERIIGADLPPSAFKYREWWANEHGRHVQAHSWMDAGWKVDSIDQERKWVLFIRATGKKP